MSDQKTPKAVMSIEELNATFCGEKLGKPYSLQLTYPKDGKMRNIYVYAETGKVRKKRPALASTGLTDSDLDPI
jgi:hypothetical protein